MLERGLRDRLFPSEPRAMHESMTILHHFWFLAGRV